MIVTEPEYIANAHVRRVTLNLIRHAKCCPRPLRPVLDKLANGVDWDLQALSRKELETIYAHVDEDLGERAKGEFEADTSTIVDLVRGTYDEDYCHCKLCGHQHIRWEFDLRNLVGGQDCKTGSVCIEQYGLNVDGETTAEAALAKLRQAISGAKKKAAREDWQEAHPNAAARIFELDALHHKIKVRPYRVEYQGLKQGWNNRAKEYSTKARAIIKYYRREKFLSDLRTEQLYDPTEGLLVVGRAMVEERDNAKAERTRREKYWVDLRAKSGFKDLEYNDRRALSNAEYYCAEPETLAGLSEWHHAACRAAIAKLEAGPVEEAPVDNSDLPC